MQKIETCFFQRRIYVVTAMWPNDTRPFGAFITVEQCSAASRWQWCHWQGCRGRSLVHSSFFLSFLVFFIVIYFERCKILGKIQQQANKNLWGKYKQIRFTAFWYLEPFSEGCNTSVRSVNTKYMKIVYSKKKTINILKMLLVKQFRMCLPGCYLKIRFWRRWMLKFISDTVFKITRRLGKITKYFLIYWCFMMLCVLWCRFI